MPQSADSNYSPRPWAQQVTGEALAAVLAESADEIRAIRPPLPITLFPPKFGYRTEALGIDDIVRLSSIYPRYDFTGKQSGYQGTSYPSLNQF